MLLNLFSNGFHAANQRARRSSRPATGGRPGDDNRVRPVLSERRFRVVIADFFVKALRRLFESASLRLPASVIGRCLILSWPVLMQLQCPKVGWLSRATF